jgi:hypothetical protein
MSDSRTPPDCSHPYQRTALDRLRRHVSVSVSDLARAVAAEEHGGLDGVTAEELAAVERELKRRHIPELVERSYVRYDEAREVVNLLGRGTDAPVEVTAADCGVDLETTGGETVSVELSEGTLEALHEAMVEREDLGRKMSYDEVIRRLAGE